MLQATSVHRKMAEQLMMHEDAGGPNLGPGAAAGERLYEKFAQQLVPLIGQAGLAALMVRSVKLTCGHLPAVSSTVGTLPGPPLAGSPLAFLDELEPALGLETSISIYATFIALLTALIGDRLTRQLLRRGFPAIDSIPKEGV